ncbi:hypothetical protein FYK55_14215 [Roseiconus nitratireducens]|uniref:LssY-like C-terminal domain-containing protein n=1 Tax=Roseiconus nitratireducens TaxID=2605748 RepID=A0A5M6D5Q5_9BACT|nr:LssY C-terminal domain-containing protein [Roseiconus nitratireducens]KAA5542683.1 hypothetical protein FYK55_14215 [Roseiconus nitratireducens]
MPKVTSRRPRLLTVGYEPHPEDKSFLDRVQRQANDDLEVKVAVLSDRESERYFGVQLAHRGLQAVWIESVNQSEHPYRLDLYSVDPMYYTPLEAAYVSHFSLGERLLSFGLLAWLFLPLLPLLPFKLASAHAANKRINRLFKQESFRIGPIAPGSKRAGFVFTHLDEGTKNLDLEFNAAGKVCQFSFSLQVPGLVVRDTDEPAETSQLREVSGDELKTWLASFARCTTNKLGTIEGDPLNLVVIGDRITIRQCFGGRWDESEAITLSTCIKTARAFLLDAGYRYSPVSSLFVDGKMQTLALQKARASINERIHLRLWPTPLAFEQQPVWIGQVSRDIGVRFTAKTWNLTTHRIDPDVDEARDYVIDNLLSAQRVAKYGYVSGVEGASEDEPRHNLTGDPYFTDGNRAVLILARASTTADFLQWS